MILGSRMGQVGALALLFTSIALSNCLLPTLSTLIPKPTATPAAERCLTDSDLNMAYDLKFQDHVLKLFDRLVKHLAPLLKQARFNMPSLLYKFPDTCLYEHPVEVLKGHGYNVYQVKITTEDEFILTAWRVRSKTKFDREKYPVLLQHGLFCSGADWLYMGEEHSLPYLLANAGYEVWIGNARGTNYSQGHKTLDAKNSSSPYWKHSVHEMGKYDVKATIESMKNLTRKDKINYVGYSMGTTMFFIYASEEKEHYTNNINRVVGLAPALYIHHLATQFRVLAPLFNTDMFHSLLLTGGKLAESEMDGPIKFNSAITQVVKVTNILLPYLVPLVKSFLDTGVLSLFSPGAHAIKNTDAFQRAMGKFPENISIRTVRHYVQFFAKKVFGRFEHPDEVENQKIYGNVAPPRYEVGNVRVPSLFIGGSTDSLVVKADAKYTADEIRKCSVKGTCAKVRYNTVPCFTHLDFVWGPEDTKELVYDQVLMWFNNTWHESYFPDVYIANSSDEYCRKRYGSKEPTPLPLV